MKIGKSELKNNLIFAPIAGFSSPPVRRLMAENNAGLTITEMVSVKGLLFGNEKTEELLRTSAAEKIKCVQLFGYESDDFYKCAQLPALTQFDIIDINMGCPVKKIVSNGEGSALMSDPQRAASIVKAIKRTGKNVTVKTRLGIKNKDEILKFAPYIRDAGADMLTVHGRTAVQMYSGSVDYDAIAAVKKLLPDMIIVANGDVIDESSYLRALETDADGIMIGRGALINPGIFNLLLSSVNIEKKSLILKLIDYSAEFYGAKTVKELRKFLPYLLKGVKGGKELRYRMNFCEDLNELKTGLENIF